MQTRAYLPLEADRFVPFGVSLSFKGIDLTGKAMAAQVRKAVNASGSPLASLSVVTTPGAEGLRLINVLTDASGVKTSYVDMRIAESTMRGMATAAGEVVTDPNDLQFAWDLKIETTAGFTEVYCYGPFTLRSGVTQ